MRAVLLGCSILSISFLCGCEKSTNVNQTTANANSAINANATAQTSPVTTAPTKRSDSNFVSTVAMDGMAEVELGRLAIQKAKSPEVKQFAQKMVADHSKANVELKQLASNKDVTLPAEPNAQQKADKDRLSKLSGAEFDREYMALMATAHNKAVAAFEDEARDGRETDVKAWASKILPTLREHQTLAKQIAAKISG
jgi:putative membrane protein